jgi:hypothetical protein
MLFCIGQRYGLQRSPSIQTSKSEIRKEEGSVGMVDEKDYLDRVIERIDRQTERLLVIESSDEYKRGLRLKRFQIAIVILTFPPIALLFSHFKWPPTLLLIVLAAMLGLIFGYFPKLMK